MSLRAYRTFQALILGSLGVYLFWKVINGQILLYLDRRLVILSLLAAVALILMAQYILRERPTFPEEDAPVHSDGGPQHGNRRGWALWLLALPVMVGLLAPERHLEDGVIDQHSIPVAIQGGAARDAEVLYLSPADGPELWRIAPDGESRVQLTQTSGEVFDYAVSPDGQKIIYSAFNEQSGIDLWQINRDGGQPQLLLPCQSDMCINPAYSPDGKTVAYSRRKAGAAPGEGPGVPRIWLIDLSTLATDILYANPDVGGFDPAWSPDGQYLAFFDGLSGGIRVLDIVTQADFLLPSQMGARGDWSPDSRNLLYTDMMANETGLYVAVYVANVQTQDVRRILANDDGQVDYSNPVWTMDGAGVVAALRLMDGSPTRQLWLIPLDLERGVESARRLVITNDQLFTHSSYRWDPAGENLVYQRLEIGSSGTKPQVCVWNRTSQEFFILAEDAFQPRWIP